MLSSVLASKELDYEFHLACNYGAANMDVYKCQAEENRFIMRNITFDRNPLSANNRRAYQQLKKIFKTEQFDIIHVNTPIAGAFGRIAAAKYAKGAKIIYTAHGFHFNKQSSKLTWMIYYPIEKWLSRKTDLLITINNEDYKVSQKFKAKETLKINGVGFKPMDIKNIVDIKKVINVTNDTKVAISVGELNNNKNHEVFIRQLPNIKEVHYVIVGHGVNEDKLKKVASTLNVSSRVHFLGYRQDVRELLPSADFFVFPSKREGLSLALMEAMNAGLPCVVSNIRGNNDLIDHVRGGFLVNEPKEYAEYVTQLLTNESLAERFKKYNSKKIEEYALDKIVPVIKNVYEKL